ncbi:MAG: hypothetical protein LBO79_10080 [Zoogloeaceae bacterium]|nr:hypothetical protein [Zoogloeaceae bacterium]
MRIFRSFFHSWSPVLAGALLLLAGCAGNPLRSYDNEMQDTLSLVRAGDVDQALRQLERNNVSLFSSGEDAERDANGNRKEVSALDSVSGKDILYYFEKGELHRLGNDIAKSRDSWLMADEIVRTWEDEYRANPAKVIGEAGAFLINDRVRRYDGQDYEKVFLSARLTLDHILLGNFDHARVEMKKTFEREKLIESFREKEYDKIKEGQKEQGVTTTTADLAKNGYPLDELDNPEVRALKNGFQNAFAHYLAGYFFETTGEYSLAEPGYRNALALRPNSRLIRAKLNKVGQNRPGKAEADVLFVLESGFAPARKSITVPIPIRLNQRWMATPLSFPVIRSEGGGYMPPEIQVGNARLPVETLVDVDAMARRLLKDQLPGIIGRTVVRAIAKSALQYQAQKHGGAIGGIVTGLFSVVTEQADERAWRTLPERLAIARANLPGGDLAIEIPVAPGRVFRGRIRVDPGQAMNVIPIRIVGGTVYVGNSIMTGQDDAVNTTPEEGAKARKAPKKTPASAGKRRKVM